MVMCLFFFYQAEDGIRDADVTGVQTCALPICRSPIHASLLCLPVVDSRTRPYSTGPTRSAPDPAIPGRGPNRERVAGGGFEPPKLSRRFYRPLPLAARATRLVGAPPRRGAVAQARIAVPSSVPANGYPWREPGRFHAGPPARQGWRRGRLARRPTPHRSRRNGFGGILVCFFQIRRPPRGRQRAQPGREGALHPV